MLVSIGSSIIVISCYRDRWLIYMTISREYRKSGFWVKKFTQINVWVSGVGLKKNLLILWFRVQTIYSIFWRKTNYNTNNMNNTWIRYKQIICRRKKIIADIIAAVNELVRAQLRVKGLEYTIIWIESLW